MRKVIIIGASSGIGRALAQTMAADVWHVGITGRRAEMLDEVRNRNPKSFTTAVFDVTAPDAITRLEELIGKMGGIDMLVFSSGTGDLDPALDVTIETRTNALNVEAFTSVMIFAYNYFLGRGGGHIAAITSVGGMRGMAVSPAYGASKAYQINFLEGLRSRSAKQKENITVTDLRPGLVDTDMMKGDKFFWVSSPQHAAQTMYKALRKGKRMQYVSPRWRFIGGLLNVMPRRLYDRL